MAKARKLKSWNESINDAIATLSEHCGRGCVIIYNPQTGDVEPTPHWLGDADSREASVKMLLSVSYAIAKNPELWR